MATRAVIVEVARGGVFTRSINGIAASVGIIRDKAGGYVVDNHCVTVGAALCVERRKLIAGKAQSFQKNPHNVFTFICP